MKKNELYRISLMEVERIHGLSSYHTIFFTTMLLRKVRHPGEKLRETVSKTMKKMETRYSRNEANDEEEEKIRKVSMKALNKTTENYGKSDVLSRAADACFDELDSALEFVTMPAEWDVQGYNVKSVMEHLMKELPVFMEVSKIKNLSDEHTKFLATIVLTKIYHPEISMWDNVWTAMKEVRVEEVYSTNMTKEQKVKKYWSKLEMMLKDASIPKEWKLNEKDAEVAKSIYEYLTTK